MRHFFQCRAAQTRRRLSLGDSEVDEKFENLAAALGADRRRALRDSIWRIDRLSEQDIDALCDRLLAKP
jgi:hypothetical protein